MDARLIWLADARLIWLADARLIWMSANIKGGRIRFLGRVIWIMVEERRVIWTVKDTSRLVAWFRSTDDLIRVTLVRV